MIQVPIVLKPVRMKNSLYLLIPKAISELLEIDERHECTLTTQREDQHLVLRYEFSTGMDRRRETVEKAHIRRAVPKQAKESLAVL